MSWSGVSADAQDGCYEFTMAHLGILRTTLCKKEIEIDLPRREERDTQSYGRVGRLRTNPYTRYQATCRATMAWVAAALGQSRGYLFGGLIGRHAAAGQVPCAYILQDRSAVIQISG